MGASAQGGVQPMGQSQAGGQPSLGYNFASPDGTWGGANTAGQMIPAPAKPPGMPDEWYQSSLKNRGNTTMQFGGATPYNSGTPSYSMGGVQQQNYQGGGDVFSNAAAGLNQAMQGTQQGMNYQPMNVQAGQGQAALVGSAPTVNAQNVTAGQIAGADLSAYTNPYESQVVQNSLGDIERARQMQANQLAAQASAAGAFGGSRSALMQSELGRNSLNQAAQTAAQLRQAGFQNAQQLAGQDIASRMQADLANQGANLQAGTTNAQLRQAVNLANQGAYNNMTQFNLGNQMTAQQLNQAAGLQGAQQRLGAANQMGNLANLGFGMGQQTQAMQQQSGTIAQAINQALIDAAKGQFGGYTGAPAQSLGYIAQALGATPSESTTTNSRDPGLFDYLTLAATAASGTNFKGK